MKRVLLTGATGYIGKRLLPVLLENGYYVVCCTRELSRFEYPEGDSRNQIKVIEVDFLEKETLSSIPKDIDGAYYLMHSMSTTSDYEAMEIECAENFVDALQETSCEHVIYLTGIINEEKLSKHLTSRKRVEEILNKGAYNFTALRAGIIIGSGSASFEIIRDLVEKLPVMITPKWLLTKCQPVGIANVLDYLYQSLFLQATYNQNFDIAGPDILTYKEMLLGYARVRGLKRYIFITPFMTPRLSSYWLYFVTSTNYKLAQALVSSMKVDVVARNDKINKLTGIEPFSYTTALERTLSKIEAHEIVSSWKDSYVSSVGSKSLNRFIEVPKHGTFVDERSMEYNDRDACITRIWSLGGENGWYAQNLWKIRGFLDQLVGGVGLRRGRTHPTHLHAGDALDFWRVLYADVESGKLLLFAEMKLPGEAWLEFIVKDGRLTQRAVFRPKGVWGRIYWYVVLPFHGIIFNGNLRYLATGKR